ncbi:MAG: hypothetical protein IJ198_13730 [Lachnospiraceae bacterium]|nr:hypothetical protein [Lachnospiraceae bacterium]
MKKRRFVSTIALTAVLALMAGCGKQEPVTTAAAAATTAAPAVVEEAKPEEPSYDTSAIISKYLRGLRDRNILEGAKNIDLLAKSESTKHVVKNITVDDSAVDMTKPGKYTARYIVTVDLDNLEKAEAYLAEHPEAMTPVKAEPEKDAADKAQAPAAKTEKTETADDTAAAEVKDDAETAPAVDDTAEPETGHTEEPGETVETEAQTPDKDTEKKEDEAPAVAPADKEDPEGAPLPVIPDSVFEEDKPQTADADKPAEPAVAEENTVPAEENTTPVEENAVPAEENTAPAEENTVPEGNTGADKDAAGQTVTDAGQTEEAVPADTENGQTSGDPKQAGNTVDVIIEKEVDVVTPDEAVKIIEDGGEVWTDNSQPVTVEEIKNPEEKPAEEVKPEETKPTEETSKPEAKTDQGNNTENNNDPEPEPSHTSHSNDNDDEDAPAPQHVHNWVTEKIYHEEKGHYETETVQTGTRTVVDEEAWDEPIYDTACVCNVCGYTCYDDDEIADHMVDEHDADGSWYTTEKQVGTEHHNAVTHEEPVYEEREHWVVDQDAWTETRTYCSGCGAEK